MIAAKAFFEVTAGVVAEIGMAEYYKRWYYTSDDYEKDCQTPPEQMTIFATRLNEAHEYAKGLSNPAYVNWVRVDWLCDSRELHTEVRQPGSPPKRRPSPCWRPSKKRSG